MPAAPYRPRHAVTADERRRETTAVQQMPEAPEPAVRRWFRAGSRRRVLLAAVGIAASVLVASTVARAATQDHAQPRSHAGRATNAASGLDDALAAPTAGQMVATPKTRVSALADVARSRVKAPVTKAVIAGLAGNGIPNVALNAYRVAADRMAHVQPSCGIDWALLAGIGREESDHGRYGGARLNPDGTTTPHIVGPALNGVGNQAIPAPPDGYALDGDRVYTHALGPMQFIPQTWAGYGADANGDGKADIFNINDAALAAARYLCANGGNLRTPAGQVRAVLAYNHSDQYVAQVLALADAYRLGLPVKGIPVGNITGPLPPITATEPYAANPGVPTAVIGTAAAIPSRDGTAGTGRHGGTTGGKPAGGATRPTRPERGGTSSGATSGSKSGSKSGSPSRSSSAPAPAPSSSSSSPRRPLPLPTTLPTKLPTALPTLPVLPTAPHTSAAPTPHPTCVVGVNGICVVP